MTSARRWVALLRGVSPVNAKMPALVHCFESAGFTAVKTVLTSGSLLFTAARGGEAALAKHAEAAMQRELGRSFLTIVRPLDALRAMLAADPFRGLRVPPGAKRVVTFLCVRPRSVPALPVERDGARILRLEGREAYTAYVPSPRGAVFMGLIEKTFGEAVTTRTWGTVEKLVAAG